MGARRGAAQGAQAELPDKVQVRYLDGRMYRLTPDGVRTTIVGAAPMKRSAAGFVDFGRWTTGRLRWEPLRFPLAAPLGGCGRWATRGLDRSPVPVAWALVPRLTGTADGTSGYVALPCQS